MPANTRLTMTAMRKNGNAKASARCISRSCLCECVQYLIKMSEVATRIGRVARRRHNHHAQPSLARKKLPCVVGEVRLLQKQRNFLGFDDAHQLGEMLARGRNTG